MKQKLKKTTATVIKNELKYSPMLEDNTLAEPKTLYIRGAVHTQTAIQNII